MTGCFISFEGGEGSGKSTQIALLAEALERARIPFIKTREPGGCESAERIRELLVTGAADAWDPLAETLLFYAARIEHVNKIIKPALAAGKTVLCDRFADSTLVYQGIGKNLSENFIQLLHNATLGNFMPGITLILDIDPAIGIARAIERRGSETRFEAMDIDFHHRIRAGFLNIAKREPGRCLVVDADQEQATIHTAILSLLKERGLAL